MMLTNEFNLKPISLLASLFRFTFSRNTHKAKEKRQDSKQRKGMKMYINFGLMPVKTQEVCPEVTLLSARYPLVSLGANREKRCDGPRSLLLGPIVCQMMNAIATISQKNNVSRRTRIRLDRLYIAYMRSCIVATGKTLTTHRVCWQEIKDLVWPTSIQVLPMHETGKAVYLP